MYLTVTLGSLNSVGRSFVSDSVHKIQPPFLNGNNDCTHIAIMEQRHINERFLRRKSSIDA
jgi:hypothetical protein